MDTMTYHDSESMVLLSRKASGVSSTRASSGQLSEAPSNAAGMPPLRSQPSGGVAAMPSGEEEAAGGAQTGGGAASPPRRESHPSSETTCVLG